MTPVVMQQGGRAMEKMRKMTPLVWQRCDSDGDNAGGEGSEDDEEENVTGLSKHERRTAAMRARIAAMEQAAIGDKDWFMRGEAQAGASLHPAFLCSCVSTLLRLHWIKVLPLCAEKLKLVPIRTQAFLN